VSNPSEFVKPPGLKSEGSSDLDRDILLTAMGLDRGGLLAEVSLSSLSVADKRLVIGILRRRLRSHPRNRSAREETTR
jgi:hypothetical protein